jgi:hypothetical protein
MLPLYEDPHFTCRFADNRIIPRDHPPPINHPEFFYGFFGVTLSWQFLFLVIGSDPVRFRSAMLPSLLEKASFAIAIPVLLALERVTAVGWASPHWTPCGCCSS